MRTNFVLIDSENVKPEYIEKLKHDHFRVVVFVGANQKLEASVLNSMQTLCSNGSYVQISSNGPNALDFLIAYYVGKLSAKHRDACFHIISRDKGFDPLIKYLKTQNVFCSRSPSVLEIPLLKSTEKIPPKQRAADFYKERLKTSKARPATVKTLQSTIFAHFHKMLSEEDVVKVLEALTAGGHVVVNGKKVTYPDRS